MHCDGASGRLEWINEESMWRAITLRSRV